MSTIDYYPPMAIIIDQAADPRQASPSSSELTRMEREGRDYARVIGGDRGDVLFDGFECDGDRTILDSFTLRTTLQDLTEDEMDEIAAEIVNDAVASVGIEALY